MFHSPAEQIGIVKPGNLGFERSNNVEIGNSRGQTSNYVLIKILVSQKTEH